MSDDFVLVAPRCALSAARPLLAARERERAVRHVLVGDGETIDADALRSHLEGAAAGLVVSNGARSPRNALPSAVISTENGRRVPVGWLPLQARSSGLEIAFGAAARVATRRQRSGTTVAVLGQWVERYLRLSVRMSSYLARPSLSHVDTVRWTAEMITRDQLAVGLDSGLGAVVYFGHGRPSGWAAYHGVRAHHLRVSEPMGAILSMTCYTASRWRVGRSFAEQMVLQGSAAAAVGAVRPVEHLENTRWMVGVARALASGHSDLGSVLAAAVPTEVHAKSGYRIIGDPLASLSGTEEGWRAATSIEYFEADRDECDVRQPEVLGNDNDVHQGSELEVMVK